MVTTTVCVVSVHSEQSKLELLMPKEENNTLKCNQDKKSLKISFVIYADTESLLEKTHTCDYYPEETFRSKKVNSECIIHYLHTIHLIAAKTNINFKEVLTVCKSSVQI